MHEAFGVVKLFAHYVRDKNGLDAKGYLLGLTAPVGAVGQLRASYNQDKTNAVGEPTIKKLGLGYVHNLSKRTALFATAARANNSGGAAFSLAGSVTAADQSSNAYEAGIRHNF